MEADLSGPPPSTDSANISHYRSKPLVYTAAGDDLNGYEYMPLHLQISPSMLAFCYNERQYVLT